MAGQHGIGEGGLQPTPPARKEDKSTTCDGYELRRLIESSTAWLEAHIDYINSLNVYPVPDGDTGTNMYLTMQAALREISTVSDNSVTAVTRALAHGALMGARGNSGVILSQIWRGVAKYLDGKEQITASDWALALREGATTAYKGVLRPVEGTILTVVREAAEAATRAAAESNDISYVLERTVERAQDALARTPELLPVLKEAGVVDAGGQGLCIILEGFLRHLRGEQISLKLEPRAAARLEQEPTPEGEYGYDIQFLIEGQNLPIDDIRTAIEAMGESVLVVGDANTIKVHVHSDDPGRVISYATSKGTLRDVVVENMQLQYRQFLAQQKQEPRPAPAAQPLSDIGIVVVVNGDGLRRVFESLGAGATVPGGQTMNPSTEELLQAIASLPANKVIVLPNNPNVILAAQQAQRMSSKEVVIVPTKSIPQGISALLAFNYQSDLKTNADLMERAASQIQTIEITNAIRSVQINGLKVQEGQFIGLLNGELVEANDDLQKVTQAVLQRIDMTRYEIITVYWGDAVTQEQAEQLASWIAERYPDKEVELVEGKQPYYHYIISVE
ncbi:MAG: DAK2 domain-containing protein [Chloroflexi bacterium]|nr:DAK2 domain-containing protein [Chloroflexota bacterium]